MASGMDPMTEIVLEELRSFRVEMNSRLDRLVTAEAFTAEKERVEGRFAVVEKSIMDAQEDAKSAIAAERKDRISEIDKERDLRKALQEQQDRFKSNMKWSITALVIPIAVFVINYFK